MKCDILRLFFTEQQHYGSTYFISKLLDRTSLSTVPPSQFPVLSLLLILNINFSRNFNTIAKGKKKKSKEALQLAMYFLMCTVPPAGWSRSILLIVFPDVGKAHLKPRWPRCIGQSGALHFPLCLSPGCCKHLEPQNINRTAVFLQRALAFIHIISFLEEWCGNIPIRIYLSDSEVFYHCHLCPI